MGYVLVIQCWGREKCQGVTEAHWTTVMDKNKFLKIKNPRDIKTCILKEYKSRFKNNNNKDFHSAFRK